MSENKQIINDIKRYEGYSPYSLNQPPLRKPKDTSKRTRQDSIVDYPSNTIQNQNKLFYGDNLDILRKHIKPESIDLIYIAPLLIVKGISMYFLRILI